MTDDFLVPVTAAGLIDVIEQMSGLPWPENGGTWIPWEIDGCEGETGDIAHVLGIGATADPARLRELTAPLVRLADQRWIVRYRFDARPYTDREASDPRIAPAAALRSMGVDTAPWWKYGDDAVLLVDNGTAAVVLVLPAQWLEGPSPAEQEVIDSALVADLLSREERRVLSAVWEVLATRDPDVLRPLAAARVRIDRATEDLGLGGALVSNDSHLAHALDRIRLFEEGRCLCAAYPGHSFYQPAKEEAAGHVRIEEVVPVLVNGRPDRPRHLCACTGCGQRWDVEEGEYHYPWWKWTALEA